ncbi:MAG: serine/threonine protein kinase, partial [Gemmatimonadota bacterium]
LYYVMPYVEGESLRDKLNRHTQLPIDDAIETARQVASALDYAHRQGVVHRDIKPENVLLQEGQAVVADFGIARALREAGGERLTETGLSLGTPHYMSPEQASATQQLDGRTDVYALGCMLYEMLAGDPPFTGPTGAAVIARQLVDPMPSLRTVRPTVSGELEQVIERALAKVPADRFETAGAFVEAAGAAARVPVIPTRERRALDRRHRERQVSRGVGAVALGAVVIGVAIAAWAFWPSGAALARMLIAVVPFETIGAELDPWRDDAAILLSSRLDGAGTLRAVPPSVVREHWTGAADRGTAQRLAGEVGSGLVLYATVVETVADSVRIISTLLDVEAGNTQDYSEVVGPRGAMSALVDSLAVHVMGAYALHHMPPSARFSSLGSSHPGAIKAFLTGAVHFRAFRPDSARLYYERAIAEDSAFALAHRALAYASETADGQGREMWMLFPPWGEKDALRLTAGALNRGLAARESLLLSADSIWAAARTVAMGSDVRVGSPADTLYLRLFGTLQAAQRRFRQDPEILYLLGHAIFAKGAGYGYSPELAIEALSGAVSLDPRFLPGYFPLLTLGMYFEGREAGMARIRQFVALADGSPLAEAFHVVASIVAAGGEGRADARRRVDSLIAENDLTTVKADVLFKAVDGITVGRVAPPAWLLEATSQEPELVLGQFGRVREAVAYRDTTLFGLQGRPHYWFPQFYPFLARVGAVPPETATPRIREYLTRTPVMSSYAIRWWFEEGDSVSLKEAIEAVRSHPASLSGSYPTRRRESVLDDALAHLALLHGDTADALGLLTSWRRCTDGVWCAPADYTAAELLAARSRTREANALSGWAAYLSHDGALTQMLHALLRGRINERNSPEIAEWGYRLVLDYWADGDPEVQPWVEEARAGLERLGLDPQ